MKKPGIFGNTDASTTRSPLVPWTRKFEIKDGHGIPLAADRTGARGVMTPSVVLHEFLESLAVLHVLARKLLVLNKAQNRLGNRADKLDPVYHQVEVFLKISGPLLEVMEVDVGRIARVRRSQGDRAAAIVGVGFENGPGEIVEVFSNELRVAGEIAAEEAKHCEYEKIGQPPLGSRTFYEGKGCAVCSVDA